MSSFALLSLTPAQANSKSSKVHQDNDRVTKYSVTGKTAFSVWSKESGDEVYTDVFVYLFDSASRGQDSYQLSVLNIGISQYRLIEECDVYNGSEECYYDYEPLLAFYGYAELDDSDFAISNGLRSASVNGVELTGLDYVSQEEKTITVDATWTGEGSIFKEKNSYHQSNPFFKYSFKGMGSSRDAVATIDIGGDLDISLNENAEYNDALIGKFREATIIVIKDDPYGDAAA